MWVSFFDGGGKQRGLSGLAWRLLRAHWVGWIREMRVSFFDLRGEAAESVGGVREGRGVAGRRERTEKLNVGEEPGGRGNVAETDSEVSGSRSWVVRVEDGSQERRKQGRCAACIVREVGSRG
jgi:hypothetical protein